MIDYHPQIVAALEEILPTRYEMALDSSAPIPCISYMELTNVDATAGETLGYSAISYQVKAWARSLADAQAIAVQIDAALRPLGFTRTGSAELYDNQSGIVQKVLDYDALALENY